MTDTKLTPPGRPTSKDARDMHSTPFTTLSAAPVFPSPANGGIDQERAYHVATQKETANNSSTRSGLPGYV